MMHFDGEPYDDYCEHFICMECQMHISCDSSCEEHKKYRRMMGEEVDFPDGELPF